MEKTELINHPEVIRLCERCERDDCPQEGCGEYKTLLRRLRKSAEEERRKNKPIPTVHKTPALLRDITEAIVALEKLGKNKDCDAAYPQAKVIRLCNEIKVARFNAFDGVVDWSAVASRMEVEG